MDLELKRGIGGPVRIRGRQESELARRQVRRQDFLVRRHRRPLELQRARGRQRRDADFRQDVARVSVREPKVRSSEGVRRIFGGTDGTFQRDRRRIQRQRAGDRCGIDPISQPR